MAIKSVVCLSLVSILGLCSSSSSGDGRHPLESTHVTHDAAKSLCQAVTKSGIDNHQPYQWIRVQKPEQTQPEPVQQKHKCFKIKFTPCLGETRVPLTKDCGIYNMVPANEEECSKSSSRTKRSVADGSHGLLSLNHGEAMHLCQFVNSVPATPQEINNVAVKISFSDPADATAQLPHPAEECVSWTYKPCESDSDNQLECGKWEKMVKPAEECAKFHSENPADHPKHAHRPEMDKSISSYTFPEMASVISCKLTTVNSNSSSEIQCQVVPAGAALPMEENLNRRVKRWGRNRCNRNCCCGNLICQCCCNRSRQWPPSWCPYC